MLGAECITGQQKKIGRPRRQKPACFGQMVSLHEGELHLDWSSATSSLQAPISTIDDAFAQMPTWSTIGMDSFDPYSTSWDAAFDHDETYSLFSHDLGFSMAIPTPQYLQTLARGASADSSSPFVSIKTMEIAGPEAADAIDNSDAMRKLSKMNVDLHIPGTNTRMNKAA